MALPGSSSDSIATVELSPFVEGQWHRIITYSPIYEDWTDMVLMGRPRPHTGYTRSQSRKLNDLEPIDINALKLEDEILLNEIHDIRRFVVTPGQSTTMRNKHRETIDSKKPSHVLPNERMASPTDDFQASSSGFFQPTMESLKHRGSCVTESSISQLQWNYKRPISSNLSIPRPVTSTGPMKTTSTLSQTGQPESGIVGSIRQSSIPRDYLTSLTHDRPLGSSLSFPSSKRTTTASAHLHRTQQQPRTPSAHTSFLTRDTNSSNALHERLTGQPLSTMRKARAKSSTGTRPTLHMLKKKNERHRQQQRGELKTVLTDPWKLPSWTDSTLEVAIPNSIDVMHKMCGPATAFERNLRQTYYRQLDRYRHGVTQC